MKKLILLCLMGFCIASTTYGQEKKNGVKLNPLDLIIGAVNVQS